MANRYPTTTLSMYAEAYKVFVTSLYESFAIMKLSATTFKTPVLVADPIGRMYLDDLANAPFEGCMAMTLPYGFRGIDNAAVVDALEFTVTAHNLCLSLAVYDEPYGVKPKERRAAMKSAKKEADQLSAFIYAHAV